MAINSNEKKQDIYQDIYNTYMDFFDNKIDAYVLYEKRKVNKMQCNVAHLIRYFIASFQNYAKINFQIDDLEHYIINKELFKKCYENYANYISGKISVGEYLNQIKITKIDLNSYFQIVRDYAECILKMSELDVEQLMKKRHHRKNTLELIENTTNENEIFEILTDYGRYKVDGMIEGNTRLGILRTFAFDYVVIKYKLDKNELDIKINSLRNKIQKVIDIYSDMILAENKQQRENDKNDYLEQIREQSIELIREFILTNLTITDFLKEKNISREYFDDALNSISKHNEELYNKYNDHINKKRSERYAVLISKIDSIVDMIKNGIINEETNLKKDFDILDYYINTNMTPEEFLNIAVKKYKGNDLRLIRAFFATNKTKNSEERIIRETKFIINSVEITDEQKDIVINYLKQIKAPISTKIFKMALKRHLKNELILEETTNRKIR